MRAVKALMGGAESSRPRVSGAHVRTKKLSGSKFCTEGSCESKTNLKQHTATHL